VTNLGPWAIRALWLLLPLAAAPALGDALASASRPVQLVATIGLWLGWTAVLVATLVPRANSLTVVRLAAPGALAATVAAAVRGAAGVDDAFAVSAAVLVVAAAWWAVTADAFADGSSYGDERRFVLRSPLSLLLAPAPVAWLLAVAAPAAAVLLLAAEAWVPGVLLAAVAAAGIRLGVPALHRLSRRWLVLVPAGLVLHDHLALPDPVLFRRGTVRGIGPAPADAAGDAGGGTLDLSLGAPGLVVEVVLLEPTDIPIATGRGRSRQVETVTAERLLIVPARPGAFLAAARDRRLPST
jgi:hypothetical protein